MTAPPSDLKEFRIEFPGNGLAHIVFDAPGRAMNVFSEAAIVEIGGIARWLEDADIRGALIRSGKTTGFCAGANLPEIWAAYDTIMATPKPRRFRAAYDHFFRLSLALRALETCGKPVASAFAGLALVPVRRAALEASLGHYPAVFAILDCVEFGLPQSFEGGIRSEMTSFSHLVLRPEPRAMIQTMFLGRVDYERLERKGALPLVAQAAVALVRSEIEKATHHAPALAAAGFAGLAKAAPLRERQQPGYWLEGDDEAARAALRVLQHIHDAALPLAAGESDEALRVADYAAVTQAGYPAYLGGPFAFRSARWD